jgi:hypothetical protein
MSRKRNRINCGHDRRSPTDSRARRGEAATLGETVRLRRCSPNHGKIHTAAVSAKGSRSLLEGRSPRQKPRAYCSVGGIDNSARCKRGQIHCCPALFAPDRTTQRGAHRRRCAYRVAAPANVRAESPTNSPPKPHCRCGRYSPTPQTKQQCFLRAMPAEQVSLRHPVQPFNRRPSTEWRYP